MVRVTLSQSSSKPDVYARVKDIMRILTLKNIILDQVFTETVLFEITTLSAW